MDLLHETLVLERRFSAPPARLFQAYADPQERAAWCTPSTDTVFQVDSTDLRDGGREVARCGPPGDLKWTMAVEYHRVEQDRLICFTEVLTEGPMLLTVALITFDLQPDGPDGCRLVLTDQITSFVGADGVSGHREGYMHAIANLDAMLGVPAS